jgi:hypothetical protein
MSSISRRRQPPPNKTIWYVYVWWHNGVPVYVGAAYDPKRYTDHFIKGRANERAEAYFRQHGHEMEVTFVLWNVTEVEAYAEEKRLCHLYELVECGGTLLNMMYGGKGGGAWGPAGKAMLKASQNRPETKAKRAATRAIPEIREKWLNACIAAQNRPELITHHKAVKKALFNQPAHLERLRRQAKINGSQLPRRVTWRANVKAAALKRWAAHRAAKAAAAAG